MNSKVASDHQVIRQFAQFPTDDTQPLTVQEIASHQGYLLLQGASKKPGF